jgi:hypothetical protein
LENYFEETKGEKRVPYVGIAEQLKVEKRLVKNWFSRRRRKMAREAGEVENLRGEFFPETITIQ